MRSTTSSESIPSDPRNCASSVTLSGGMLKSRRRISRNSVRTSSFVTRVRSYTRPMAIGLVVYDLLYMILCSGLYGGALWVGGQAFAAGSAHVPWPLALIAAALSSLVTLVAAVGVLTALVPRLKPGRYTLMKGTVFYAWILRSMLRRVLFVPGLKFVLFSSNVLRF